MFWKSFSAAFLSSILLLSPGAGVGEEQAALDAQAARAVMKSMDLEPTMVARFQSCPADVFRKDATVGGLLLPEEEIAEDLCTRSPAQCLSACVTKGSGVHCFRLAVAFQGGQEIVPSRYPQMLFATACALGKASGCTNRAAYLRNAMADNDPLQRLTGDQLAACQFRSFKIACEQSDSWGCAMLGQSYRRGEGRDDKQGPGAPVLRQGLRDRAGLRVMPFCEIRPGRDAAPLATPRRVRRRRGCSPPAPVHERSSARREYCCRLRPS